jgi:hypothetical protein
MRTFDHDYAEEVLTRLKNVPQDATPCWGYLTRDQLYAHLTNALRYSMGRSGEPVNNSNWFSRNIIRPLLLWGVLRIPKNVKIPGLDQIPDGDLETLQAVIEDYLSLVQADEFEPYPHIFFGELDVDKWGRLHVVHFEHHLRQFNA